MNTKSFLGSKLCFDPVHNRSKRPFGSNIVCIFIFIGLEVFILFVNCIVCKVHEEVAQVAWLRGLIRFSCKSGKAFVEKVNSQGRNSHKKNVDSQIKLKAVDYIGLSHVTLNHIVFILVKVFNVSRQENSLSLTTCFRLWYKSFRPFMIKLSFKLSPIRWKKESLRKEVVSVRKEFLHFSKVPSQKVFPSQVIYARKMVCPLVGLHSLEKLCWNRSIKPSDIPVLVLILCEMHVKANLPYFLNRIVLSELSVHN